MVGVPISELFGLEDRVAVVTGASGVLGGAIARGLAAAGARVGLLARRRDRLDALAQSLGESAIVLEADVLDTAQLEQARSKVLDRWGRVDALVNVSSLAAHRALTRVVGYGAAKAAVENLTRWLAVELAPHGVRVNAVAPGFFLGEQNRALLLDESGA